ncbi:SRPBCC domain-containing protein [Noviherbaspirillum saxi]|uniref:SRPBCC domain-containing protein n=1 Tax=Noviherbaspirillum saxi TaxID=2320863 RepID=A0A3A3FGN6_9BURK|nr:SRPBCC domain-containing protein [Noviherbaspirillum saxi]RJF92551.1 SRPBCC domain-containing protein [Noviherbaspirillum saxi]
MCKAENLVTSVKVEINAPASLVWDVLMDLASYPQWNPYTVRVESSLQLGEPVNLYLPDPTRPGEHLHVVETLVAFEPHALLSWEMRPTAQSKDAARRDQYIEAMGEDHCVYYTTDIFLGLNADATMKNFGAWVKQGFDAVALGVKQRAELLYAAQRTRGKHEFV